MKTRDSSERPLDVSDNGAILAEGISDVILLADRVLTALQLALHGRMHYDRLHVNRIRSA